MIERLNAKHLKYIASTKKDFVDAWDYKMLESGVNNRSLYGFVALDGKTPVGYITFSIAVDSSDIECVFVEEAFRRKGYANLLMQRAIDFLKEKKVVKILLEVRESNLSAISLYNKFGFEQISQRKKYYFDGENALVLIKEL